MTEQLELIPDTEIEKCNNPMVWTRGFYYDRSKTCFSCNNCIRLNPYFSATVVTECIYNSDVHSRMKACSLFNKKLCLKCEGIAEESERGWVCVECGNIFNDET